MKASVLQLFALLVLGIGNAYAQPYSITGQPGSGGGVTSGGRFQITAACGQPEAGPRLSGRCWFIEPGFWTGPATGSPADAPALRVRRLDFNYVRVSFTPGCGESLLQWTRTLSTAPTATVWTDDPASNLTVIGEELVRDFHVPSWGPGLFFRLREPAPSLPRGS